MENHPFVMPDDSRVRAQPLGAADWLLMALFVMLMALFTYLHARDRMLWGDELMGWKVMHEPTFSRMINRWWAGLDSGSLFYMVGGRLWMKVFGSSELSLRAFSSAGMMAAFLVLWVTLRRFYRLGVVMFALATVFFTQPTLSWQFFNGRMYGGFIAASALVVYAFCKADPRLPLSSDLLWLTFGAHLFLLANHILGPLYSGAFILGLIAQDTYGRRFRPKLYLSALSAWPLLLLTYRNTLSAIALGKPTYWTVRPSLKDLVRGVGVYDRHLIALIGGLFVLALVLTYFPFSRNQSDPVEVATPSYLQSTLPVYWVIATFACLLVFMWIVSRFTTSVFFNRYLLPITIMDVFLLCELTRRVLSGLTKFRVAHYGVPAVALAYFVYMVAFRERHPIDMPYPNYTTSLLERDTEQVPMVFNDVMKFAEMEFYQHGRITMLTPVDWSVALDPDYGPGGVSGPHEMDNWKASGYYSSDILPTQEILSRYPTFLVINDGHTLWFRRYILNNPHYVVVRQPSFQDDDVWLVERRS